MSSRDSSDDPSDDGSGDLPIFRKASTLRYEGLTKETREAARQLASRRAATAAVRPRHSATIPAAAEQHEVFTEDPALLIDALNPHLAWLAEDRRPALNGHVLRGDLEAALTMLREELRRYPKNLSIARSVQVIERAAIHRYNRRLEPLDRVVTVVRPHTNMREPVEIRKLCELIDGASTLEDVIRRSPLKRLETLRALSDLMSRGLLAAPRHTAVVGHRDPRAEDSSPGRRETPTANPARMARLAKQLGMDLRDDPTPAPRAAAERSAPAEQLDDGSVGDRATLSDPIESEARAALMRTSLRPKAPSLPPISREEPDEPSALAVESIKPLRIVSIGGLPEPSPPPPTVVEAVANAPTSARAAAERREATPEPPVVEPAAKPTKSDTPVVEDRPRVAATAEIPSRFVGIGPGEPEPVGFALSPLARNLVIGAACLAACAGVYFATQSEAPDDQPRTSLASSGPSAVAAAPPLSLPPQTVPGTASPPTSTPPDPTATTIRLHIEVSPDYAKVTLDGKKLKAPFDGSMAKDGVKHLLKIDAPGHKPRKIEFSATADTNLMIALEALQKATPSEPTAAPAPAPTADPDVYD